MLFRYLGRLTKFRTLKFIRYTVSYFCFQFETIWQIWRFLIGISHRTFVETERCFQFRPFTSSGGKVEDGKMFVLFYWKNILLIEKEKYMWNREITCKSFYLPCNLNSRRWQIKFWSSRSILVFPMRSVWQSLRKKKKCIILGTKLGTKLFFNTIVTSTWQMIRNLHFTIWKQLH